MESVTIKFLDDNEIVTYYITENENERNIEKNILCKNDTIVNRCRNLKINEIGTTKDQNGIEFQLINKKMINNCTSIEEIIELRNIDSLFHFTRLKNLETILKYGLIPKNEHSDYSIYINCNDEHRLDQRLDCTSCSIGFPNYKMFYKYRLNVETNNDEKDKWVIMKINPKVLLEKKCIFCYTNAANTYIRSKIQENDEFYTSYSGLNSMFMEECTYKDIKREKLNIKDNMTTDPQAEVLIKGKIEVNYLEGIIISSDDNLDHIRTICSDSIDIIIDNKYFDKRNDYEYWKSNRNYGIGGELVYGDTTNFFDNLL